MVRHGVASGFSQCVLFYWVAASCAMKLQWNSFIHQWVPETALKPNSGWSTCLRCQQEDTSGQRGHRCALCLNATSDSCVGRDSEMEERAKKNNHGKIPDTGGIVAADVAASFRRIWLTSIRFLTMKYPPQKKKKRNLGCRINWRHYNTRRRRRSKMQPGKWGWCDGVGVGVGAGKGLLWPKSYYWCVSLCS